MIVTKSENIKPFDVDGCLVSYDYAPKKGYAFADVIDPVTQKYIRVRVNQAMVRLLKEEFQRGSYVIVWSRSGWEWARNVVLALGVEDYVMQVLSKPIVYFDDSPVNKWLRDRIFLEPDTKYKV
jgi:hypothetical protein